MSELYCPLMKVAGSDGLQPAPCMREQCGFWYEASNDEYSRCSVEEMVRQLVRLGFIMDTDGDKGKGRGRGRK